MFHSLIPDYRISHFNEITPLWLIEKGINTLLVDLDNTLVARKINKPTSELIKWISLLKEQNIKVAIVSNNKTEHRVKLFGEMLGIPYFLNAGKPGIKTIYKAIKELNSDKNKTAVLGDQLATDILGAHRAGIMAVLTCVRPGGDLVRTRMLRWCERRILPILDYVNQNKL